MRGRSAVSKNEINSLMLGLVNPENVPEFRKDSGSRKAIDQINRELETNYNITSFIDKPELSQIKAKYMKIPLGLSETARQEYLKTTPTGKIEQIITTTADAQRKRINDQ